MYVLSSAAFSAAAAASFAGLASSFPLVPRQFGLAIGSGGVGGSPAFAPNPAPVQAGGPAPVAAVPFRIGTVAGAGAAHYAHDWQCKYTGPLNSAVDSALNLPGLASDLCLKVGYAHPGCDNFKPPNVVPTSSTHRFYKPTTSHTTSKPKTTTTSKPKTTTTSKPKTTTSGTHRSAPTQQPLTCAPSQKYSPRLGNCLDVGHYVPPSAGGNCPQGGSLDSVLNLCVGLNLLSHPAPAQQAAHAASLPGCPSHQAYSSLASACVDLGLLKKPASGATSCTGGNKLDSVLNLCVDASVLSHPDPAAQRATHVAAGVHNCPGSQRYSTVLKTCIDTSQLAQPTQGNCPDGEKLDAILKVCLPGVVSALSISGGGGSSAVHYTPPSGSPIPNTYHSTSTTQSIPDHCPAGTTYSFLNHTCVRLSAVHQPFAPVHKDAEPGCPNACKYDATAKVCVELKALEAGLRARQVDINADIDGILDLGVVEVALNLI